MLKFWRFKDNGVTIKLAYISKGNPLPNSLQKIKKLNKFT